MSILKVLPKNENGRDFVVGDLHGCFDQLNFFLDVIEFDTEKDRLFSVGDLVDRGPNSQECLELLKHPWFHAVRGNHEDLMQDYLLDGPTGMWWFPNGGKWFNDVKYSTSPQLFSVAELKGFVKREVIPLPLVITVPGAFTIVHAELSPGGCQLPITDEDLTNGDVVHMLATELCSDGISATWERNIWYHLYAKEHPSADCVPERIVSKFKNTWPIVSGHTPVAHPTVINGNLINIDTMAFGTGKRDWAGLTFFEPATDSFWTVKNNTIEKVEPTRLNV